MKVLWTTEALIQIARGMGCLGDFVYQGPTIFASGVLVALLLKDKRY